MPLGPFERRKIKEFHDENAALRARAEKAEARADNCEQQAKIWKQEARTQSAIVAEIYQELTGKTGEPGDWNGVRPLKPAILRKQAEAVEAAKRNYNEHSRASDETLSDAFVDGFVSAESEFQDSLDNFAQRLRTQAAEMEKGENS